MSRWELLRNSLHGNKTDKKVSQSIHRFDGHGIAERKKVLWMGFTLYIEEISNVDWPLLVVQHFEQIDCPEFNLVISIRSIDSQDTIENRLNEIPDITWTANTTSTPPEKDQLYFVVRHQTYQPLYSRCQFIEYRIASCALPILTVVVRIQDESRKFSIKELASDHHFGVDNTGNVCVWESEAVLLHTLLSNPQWTNHLCGKRVLEIGGGQSALCGLGTAFLASEVILTDGHPHCVRNQQVCIEMCRMRKLFSSTTAVRSQILEWSNWKNSSITPGSMEVILASDCLFFRDFHDALVEMLHGLLHDHGVVILLQPPRSGSMEQFKEKACVLFDIEEHFDYDTEMSQKRDHFLEHDPSYALDVQYPVLMILRKKSSTVT